ncbi:AsmA-like C-terminal region-containing protein [Tenacibaculum jejuense]|uniref:Outer membrane assembly protein n=1 Tax=Tenacibaculum jejuense TaxID=584609 RepID=A0A238UGM2_9FLAO|nr:AsmA-like C-terminal region-containing protein [Tenacibaculum jejuense]SNR17564.1 Outer membrane assembly protein [Tenacibaculum jejuense]
MKKIVKIVVITLVVIIVALAAIPFMFQDKIVALIKETINNNVNAKVEFADANLSLLKNFPKASVELKDVLVTNFKPFEGDTLLYSESVKIKLKLTEVFKSSNSQLNINSFTIDNSLVKIHIDEQGNANYDIAKKDASKAVEEKTEEATGETSNFSLSLKEYAITNATLRYHDDKGKMDVVLSDFNHSGSGDFSQKTTELDTKTTTNILFEKDGKALVKNQHLDLNAVLALDLKNSKYSFLKNEAHINQLPLIFDGFVQLNKDNSQEVHVNFKTPSSDFKNFLALIPEEYAKNISDVKTTGDFSIIGKVDGKVTETTIPKIDVTIASNNASFKYPSLPKSVKNIRINTQIKNTTGNVDDTYVNLQKLAFKIDENEFSGNAKVSNLTKNPYINSTVNGKIDLSHIDKVYPLELKNDLSGIITANLTSSFDIDAVQNNKYQRIKNSGNLEIKDFLFSGEQVANPIQINAAKVDFAPKKISLTKFNAVTGTSDLNATGTINNLLGFLLSDKNLQGNFNLNSNSFKVSDFMVAETETSETPKKETPENKEGQPKEKLKIPAFLDCVVNASAKEVYYDNLKLSNVQGKLIIKDEKATLQNVNGNMFGGTIALNGAVNTQKEQPVFDMDMGIKSFNISESFKNIELFKMLSPIADVLQGKLNTNLNLSGNLNDDFTPNLTSMTGKALAEVLATNVEPKNSKALSLLDQNLGFVDLKQLNLKDIKTNLSFDNGKVNVKPFNLKYKDIDIQVGGSHGFDQLMDYNATFNVPAKYLGSEVSNLLGKLDSKDQNVKVPVTANFSGSFTNPSVKTDLKSAVSNLTTQLVQKQKNKLLDKAVGGLLGNKNNKASATDNKKDNTVNAVKDVLGGLFGKKKKKKDEKKKN